jgi:hypothetical protein
LRTYLSTRLIPSAEVSRRGAQAHRRGMAAYKQGDYVTLGEYIDGMDRRSLRARKNVSRPHPGARPKRIVEAVLGMQQNPFHGDVRRLHGNVRLSADA